jgi:uncharacterized protein
MKTNHITNLFLITLVAAVAAGCASAPAHYYTLNSTAAADGAPAATYAVLVGPVSVPATVDRPQFVIQVATNRLEVDEFDRWAEPLNENIARTVAGDLTVLLGTPFVTTKPMANFDSAYRITIDIQRFESLRGPLAGNGSVLIEAVWVVRHGTAGTPRSGHMVSSESVNGDDFAAFAAAHSRALAKVSGEIAATIRAQGGEK